ncbi:hypothetical protein FRC02_011774 [Tulasnella sp. 418]|nr:hypothetical protein FRC02_011774 [Tulasnella sp. 418]
MTNFTSDNDCFIDRLPYEIFETILLSVIDSEAPKDAQRFLSCTGLVCKAWRILSDHLALIKLGICLPSDYNDNHKFAQDYISKIKSLLRGSSENGRPPARPCKYLYIDARAVHRGVSLEGWLTQVFELIGSTLQYIWLRGPTSVAVTNDQQLFGRFSGDSSQPIPFSFPRLQQLYLYDLRPSDVWVLLKATGSDHGVHPAPSQLIVHHNFELFREQHVLSLPYPLLGPTANSSQTDLDISSLPDLRDPLDLYIDRRADFAEFVEHLKNTGLPRIGEKGIQVLKIWLKDAEEMPLDLDFIIRESQWRKYIDWDVKAPSTQGEGPCESHAIHFHESLLTLIWDQSS